MKHAILLLTLLLLPLAQADHPPVASPFDGEELCPTGSYWAYGTPEAFANSVVDAKLVKDADKVIGVNDYDHAYLSPSTTSEVEGYLIVDMGAGEEVFDRIGVDLKAYGDDTLDQIDIYVSNSPNSGWKYADTIDNVGGRTARIDGTGFEYVRYIKFVNPNFDDTVEIDAIQGKCIRESVQDVPEFGTIAAAVLLAVIGLFIYKRREN